MSGNSSDAQAELIRLRRENELLREKLRQSGTQEGVGADRLSLPEYERYGRQMIVESTGGVQGQLLLKSAKVLVVGAGGLGSPCLPYLAGAGVGTIGIVDNDTVEVSNLHRQVIHDSGKVGMLKCESAREVLGKLNPNVKVVTYPVRLDYSNAFRIFEGYDIVLDCTDTPLTRYLVSDVAVNLGMTVVSASGLGTEGQLSVLNFQDCGPCYRCFYPTPPPPTSVASCSEGGVIGPCIGIVGVMMAVETIKIILGVYTKENFKPFLMMYSGFPGQTIRTFKMRGRQPQCIACGTERTITKETIESGIVNYNVFCGSRNYNVCQPEERISVSDLQDELLDMDTTVLLDVRPSHHYKISHLPHTVNVPMKELRNLDRSVDALQSRIPQITESSDVLVICRHGNESQLATRLLKDEFNIKNVRDVTGGLFKYIDEIDPSMPKY